MSIEVLSTDIGDAVDGPVSNRNKYNLLTQNWTPPKGYEYPTRKQGSHTRRFQHTWLTNHSWLAYSKRKDGAFCKWCVLFAREVETNLGQLVTCPLHEFAKGVAYLANHAKLGYHIFAKEKAQKYELIQRDEATPVDRMLNVQAEIASDRIRNGLETIVKAVIYLARQGQPLRGHRNESSKDLDTQRFEGTVVKHQEGNPGNFMNLLALMCASDQSLKDHVQKSARNKLYISKFTQNAILALVAQQLTEEVTKQIIEAGEFSLMIDECGDRSNKEQLAVTVRYVHKENICEKFLTLIECKEGTTGEAIAKMILDTLEKNGLQKHNLVALTTDGASNMTGRIKGAAALVKEQVPSLQHIHCLSHNLNLVIVAAAKDIYIQTMFATVQSAYTFFSTSPKRTDALKKVIEKSSRNDRVKLKLKAVCTTRWVERYNALETILLLLEDIVHTLEDIIAEVEWNKDTQDRAASLLEALTTYKFIVLLVTATHVLLKTKGLCKKLQGRSYELVSAMNEVDETIEKIEALRDGCVCDEYSNAVKIWFEEIDELCTALDIVPTMPRVARRQINRTSVPAANPQQFYIRNAICPFLDHISSGMRDRYDLKNKRLLGLFSLLPDSIRRIRATNDRKYMLCTTQSLTYNTVTDNINLFYCMQAQSCVWLECILYMYMRVMDRYIL